MRRKLLFPLLGIPLLIAVCAPAFGQDAAVHAWFSQAAEGRAAPGVSAEDGTASSAATQPDAGAASPDVASQAQHSSATSASPADGAPAAGGSVSRDTRAPLATTARPPTTTAAQAASVAGFSVVQNFSTPVAAGQWPGNGSAPAAYPGYLSYADGTSGKYYPSQVLSVHDGVLDWNCHASKAAAVLPFGYQGFQYGTYSVRMRTDRFPGYHIAFLLWPNTNKWTHEIDGPEEETASARPYPAVLQGTSPSVTFAPSVKTAAPASWNDPAFHNYTWQWGPGFLSFYQDGTKVTTVTTGVPNEPMHPVLQVEFSNQLKGSQAPDPSIQGHVYVARVMYAPGYDVPPPTA